MKSIAAVALAIGIISLVVGIVSRFTLVPLPPVNIKAHAILQFTNTCLLLSIALLLFATLKNK